jgi:hypothetical protein
LHKKEIAKELLQQREKERKKEKLANTLGFEKNQI